MNEAIQIQCPRALLQRKVLWCTALNNFCGHQRHCNVKGHAVLTEQAKTCPMRENKP